MRHFPLSHCPGKRVGLRPDDRAWVLTRAGLQDTGLFSQAAEVHAGRRREFQKWRRGRRESRQLSPARQPSRRRTARRAAPHPAPRRAIGASKGEPSRKKRELSRDKGRDKRARDKGTPIPLPSRFSWFHPPRS